MTNDKPELGKRSGHWPHVRASHLAANPTCAACGGKDALEVHHCKPFHLHPDLELDPTNLITLCEKPGHDCHYVFGHAGNWHGFVPTVREDAAKHLADVQRSNELAAA
ncbi:MAG TPA: hypothetical protein VFE62_01625 [Gemmataceae bacterium]|nr:hypothetical protein [Gemmataceae bacterium]